MAAEQAMFEQAMERGREAARRGDWATALQAARQAVQAMPTHVEARQSLAIALYHNTQYGEAIQLLEALRQQCAENAVVLTYLARAYENDGLPDRAIDVLVALGEQAIRQRLLTDALDAFEEAVRLAPQRENLRIRLAELLLELDEPQQAAQQCVEIARLRLAKHDLPGASEALKEALELDPANRAASLLNAELLRLPDAAPEQDVPVSDMPPTPDPASAAESSAKIIEQLVLQASAYQQTGDGTSAARLFQQAIDYGADQPDVFYNLAVLYQEQGEHGRAIPLLHQAAADAEYELSAHYALGNSLRAVGDLSAAAEAYEHMLHLVELEAVSRAEADDLYAMFQAAAETQAELGNFSRAASLYSMLADFFQKRRWNKELATECQTRAKQYTERSMSAKLSVLGTGMLQPPTSTAQPRPSTPSDKEMTPPPFSRIVPESSEREQAEPIDPFEALDALMPIEKVFPPVTPIDVTGCDEAIVRLVDASGRFVEQGLLWAAIDACHEVMRHDGEYLPIHLRLGEIYERAGHVEAALDKYRMLVDCYVARGLEAEAVDVYRRVIDLAPEAVDVRAQLVRILRKSGRIEEALDHALTLANTYFRLGQTDRALEEFKQIHRWAPSAPRLHKEYGQALFKLERWQAAQAEFGRAAQLDPDDPVALAQLTLTIAIMGQDDRAVWERFAALRQKLHGQPQHQPAVHAEFRTALSIVDAPLLHYLLGLLQQTAHQHAAALLEFEQALRRVVMEERPRLAPVLIHQAMAESYLEQDQPKDALDHLQTALRLLHATSAASTGEYLAADMPSGRTLQRRLASIHRQLAQPEAALEILLRCHELDPHDTSVVADLAQIYGEQGRAKDALEYLLALAVLYERQQRLDEASDTLRQALQLAPDSPSIRTDLARTLLRRGYADEGLALLEEGATRLYADGQRDQAVAALQQAAELWWMLGRLDGVQHMHQQVVAWAPDCLEARQHFAHLYLLAGQPQTALAELHYIAQSCLERQDDAETCACLEQIAALAPDDAQTFERLGALAMRQHDFETAVRAYRHLAQLRPDDADVQARLAAAEQELAAAPEQPS